MPDASPAARRSDTLPIGFREFVGLIAAIMAVNALGVDSMLPALPEIGQALGIAKDNQRQWVVAAYLLGFGAAQLVYGPLADRYGRKPTLLIGLASFAVFSVVAAFATSFETMIIARVLQGVGSAASRVLAVSIVRDCYSGRQMARVMSLSFIVFLAVPIFAPSIGQIILLVAPWPWIFGALGLYGALIAVWVVLRLPETLDPADRLPITPHQLLSSTGLVLKNRYSLGYTLAMTMMVGALFGFINSVQQIFADALQAPDLLALVFAVIGGCMAISSFVNSRIVERFGTRKVSHSALLGFIVVAAIHFGVSASGHETLVTFTILQALMMACFGFAGSNFGSMAMEDLGHLAGSASSMQGFITTVGGSLLGIVVGQQFDGTTVPVTAAFVLFGLGALGIVLVTEGGRLFHGRYGAAIR